MAMLQTVINPLKRVAGGEENFAFFSVLGQLVFGLASFISPFVYSYLVTELSGGSAGHSGFIALLSKVTPANLPWVSLYWIFAIALVVIIIVVSTVSFPKIKLEESEKSGSFDSYIALFKNKYVILFFLGIFSYVSVEQGIANWIAEFLRIYYDVPAIDGVKVVGWFWGTMSIGCLVGLFALKLFDVRNILKVAAIGAIVCLIVALFAGKESATIAFPAVAFFISVMFSSIMSLGLNSVSEHHGSFAGILCTGIAGGAVGPLVVGGLADLMGLQMGMCFLIIPLVYILSIGFWARPLINNKTISLKRKKA
jgi:fucose permease